MKDHGKIHCLRIGPHDSPCPRRLSAGDAHLRERAGRVVPAPVPIRLLIDTGAKRTILIPGIIRHLDPSAGDLVRDSIAPCALRMDAVVLGTIGVSRSATGSLRVGASRQSAHAAGTGHVSRRSRSRLVVPLPFVPLRRESAALHPPRQAGFGSTWLWRWL